MTDKPIDLTAGEARIQLRQHQRQIDSDGTFVGVSRQALEETLDALDARDTLVVAGGGQKCTIAQAEIIANELEALSIIPRRNPQEIGNDAARMIRYLAAMLDAANVRYENSNQHLGDTVQSFLWVQGLQSKYKGNALLEPLLTKHWGGQIGALAEELVDVLFAEVADLGERLANARQICDEVMAKHRDYVIANPAPVRLAGGQVVRFVSPVTPQEVQILSDDPARDAFAPDFTQPDSIEIIGQAEMTLPEGVDTFPTDAIMPEIADTPAALEMAEMIKRPSLTPETILAAAQVLENELAELNLFMTTPAKYNLAKRMLLAAGMGEA